MAVPAKNEATKVKIFTTSDNQSFLVFIFEIFISVVKIGQNRQ
jgi:hypothetical protein